MSLQKIISKLLGRPGDFDVDTVTSILKGRDLPRQTATFQGFDSPPGRF
jgi:hypothetical protein